MPSKHSTKTLTANSRFVGRKCPVTRTTLKVGEQVVICDKNDEAFLWSALPVLEGDCPYCGSKVDLSMIFDSSSRQNGKTSQKKKWEEAKPTPTYQPVRHKKGLGPLLFILLAIIGVILLGIVAVAIYRYRSMQPTLLPTVTAQATVKETESPVPTAVTLTNTPRASSTPRPTPTVKPSSTPSPPSPTPCNIAVGTRFTAVWNQYVDRLGCPLNQAHTHEAASQGFERGAMLWRVDPDQVYVMYNDGRLEFYPMLVYPESVRQNPPGGDPNIDPPAGFQQPVRGFGLIWRDNPQVREGVGWAVEGESRADWFYGFVTQDFVGGTIIHECRMGVRVLLSSGEWIKASEGASCE